MDRRKFLQASTATLVTTSEFATSVDLNRNYLVHSIDAATNDNGALSNLRRHMRPSLPNNTTVDVVSNFLSVSSSGKIKGRICGHANAGLILTGCGQISCGSSSTITSSNDYYWRDMFTLLSGVMDRIELWGCHPGAKSSGATLLFKMAQAANCDVLGLSGFLYANNRRIWAEAGSVWVKATPTEKPNPVDPPSLISADYKDAITPKEIKIWIDGEYKIVKTDALESIELLTYSSGGQEQESQVLTGREVKDILKLVRLDQPFKLPGKPLAIVTAEIILLFQFENTNLKIRFKIFNDRIASTLDGEVGYPIYEEFEDIQNSLFKTKQD